MKAHMGKGSHRDNQSVNIALRAVNPDLPFSLGSAPLWNISHLPRGQTPPFMHVSLLSLKGHSNRSLGGEAKCLRPKPRGLGV